ncbi:MAG: DbpA RNA binding domain-containing protein [Sphaerochaetaceae bacterium]|nr:DbpA RNA binding domain-containing protein [Sphaerochaetaceae bacterium]
MEQNEIAKKANKACPWLVVLTQEDSQGLENLENVSSKGIFDSPVIKRTLFVTSRSFNLEQYSNIEALSEDETDDSSKIKLENLGVSIAASSSKAVDALSHDIMNLGTFGRVLVFGFGAEDEGFDNDMSYIISKISSNSTELIIFTDKEEKPAYLPEELSRMDLAGFLATKNQAPASDYRPREDRGPRDRRDRDSRPRDRERRFEDRGPRPERSERPSRPERSERPERLPREPRKPREPRAEREPRVFVPKYSLDEAGITKAMEELAKYPDPSKIEEVSKLIKKNVGLFQRSNFMAYLLLSQAGQAQAQSKPRKQGGPSLKSRPVPADSKTFYINVGSQDNCSPKDLIGFICNEGGLASEDIYALNFRNNFSFFTVEDSKCEKLIDALNGKNLKKKTVKINYAKPKEQKAEEPAKAEEPKEE